MRVVFSKLLNAVFLEVLALIYLLKLFYHTSYQSTKEKVSLIRLTKQYELGMITFRFSKLKSWSAFRSSGIYPHMYSFLTSVS